MGITEQPHKFNKHSTSDNGSQEPSQQYTNYKITRYKLKHNILGLTKREPGLGRSSTAQCDKPLPLTKKNSTKQRNFWIEHILERERLKKLKMEVAEQTKPLDA